MKKPPLDAAEGHLRVEMVPIGSLVPYARNARTHSESQVRQLVASMREFGWTNPVLIDADGGIIAGHGRVLAGEQMGREAVPCIRLGHLTDLQKRAYILADNKLALNAGWDEDMLRAELAELGDLGFDLDLAGFSSQDLTDLFAASDKSPWKTSPDEAPAPAAVPTSRPGEVWLLGVHRLICGDARSPADMGALLEDERVDACWTDPPYNVDYSGKAGKIQNDSMGDAAFRAFLTEAMKAAFDAMKPGAAIYVAHADTEGLNFRSAFQIAGFKTSGCLIWVKDSLVLGRSDYQWQHEPILYGWKPGASHRWFGGRKQTTLRQLEGSAFTHNPDGTVSVTIGLETLVISGQNLVATVADSSLIRFEKPKRSAEHPTMKPVELISRMLRNSTVEGDVVLDGFGGSGSTLIACEMLGRQARLCEIDPRFADVIVRRWQNFTGRAAMHAGTGLPFPAAGA